MTTRVVLSIALAATLVVACGRAVGSAGGSSSATPAVASLATAASASPTPQLTGAHVHTGAGGVETILGVRVIELTPTVIRGQWNQEQVLVRTGPDTRFAEVAADGQVHFSTGQNFATAGVRPGDKLNLAVDWGDRSADGAYLVILATKL